MQDSSRMYGCLKCNSPTIICRHCDRGNRYCKQCAPVMYLKARRRANKRYQNTYQGRINHAARQKRYRERLKLDPAVKPREIAASTDAPGYGNKVLITNKVTTNFFPTPITPLATTLSTSSTAGSRLKQKVTHQGSKAQSIGDLLLNKRKSAVLTFEVDIKRHTKDVYCHCCNKICSPFLRADWLSVSDYKKRSKVAEAKKLIFR